MNLCFFAPRHCFALGSFLLIAWIVGANPTIASAGDFDCGSDIVPVYENAPSCEAELAGTEELCRWAELGTHDSGVLPTPAQPPADERVAEERTLLVDSSLTAIASAALASKGVSIEQIVEPFAMVGPYLEGSLESVRRFQDWWGAAIRKTGKPCPVDEPFSTSTPIDIQVQLEAIAAQEPVDTERLGPSVLANPVPNDASESAPGSTRTMAIDLIVGSSPVIVTVVEEELQQSGIEVTAIDPLVGSSPIIASIDEEAYLPYDLSARDIKLWSVFPLATQPFCVRSRVEEMDTSPMWREFDEIVVAESDQQPDDTFVCNTSADCLLGELIWKVETWTASDSPLRAVLTPRNIGRHVAMLVSGGNRLLEGAAQMLAASWPDVEESQASPAGQALLARAGAIEATVPVDSIGPIGPIASAETQIVELPSGTDRY